MTQLQQTQGTFDPNGFTFSNGDNATGYWYTEENQRWYIAIDKNGNEYETTDKPTKQDFFNNDFNTQYALALRIGNKRFGSECNHENVKNGHCANCLRKVVQS